ncbi:MAG: RNA polymerase sigma factor [Saprospiraceae bacterium]
MATLIIGNINSFGSELTEMEIIRGCQKGIAHCQKELVVRYSPYLMTISRRYCRDNEQAKDILQDSYIKIFKGILKFKPTGSFKGWMARILINTALQTFDKSCFKKEISGLDELVEPSQQPGIYAYLGAEELMALVQQLPDGFKQVFNLYVVEDYSHREIAELLGITESTSRSQLVRARKCLQNMLQKRDKIRV